MGLITAFLMVLAMAYGTLQQAPAPASGGSAQTAGLATPPIDLGPFAPCRIAPPDATLFVHVENARILRRDLAHRPIAAWLASLAGDSAGAKAWKSLAASFKMDEAQLFDACFGRSCTLVVRNAGEWVVISDMGEQRTRAMLRTLQVRVREPRFGLAISELPEQDVLLAADGDRMAIGPSAQPQLLFDVLQRWDASRNAPQANDLVSLATDDEFRQRLAALPVAERVGEIAVFIRHEPPMGGCSLLTAQVRGDDVKIAHSAQFDNAPFVSPVTRLSCDFSPLSLFNEHSLVAVMQPRDVGDGPMESYLTAGLGMGLISADMRGNLADRRLLVVGEHDARQLPEPADILTTTFVACLEVKDPSKASQQLDSQMARLARRLNDLGRGAFLIQVPGCGTLKPGETRHADLGAAAEWFTGGFPVMRTVSLNWAIAESPRDDAADDIGDEHGEQTEGSGRGWFVIGSNPVALKEAVETLRKPCPRNARMVGRYDSCGTVNGIRLGRHVESWSEQAQEFAEPENVAQVRSTLQTFSHLALGLKDCRWQMARPTPNTMRLNVQVRLAPAETAGK